MTDMTESAEERLVAAIIERAQPELDRRRQAQRFGLRMLREVQQRSTPVAAAAAVVALISTLAMMWFGPRVASIEAQVPTLAAALAPEAYADWIVSGERPAVSALMVAFDAGSQR